MMTSRPIRLFVSDVDGTLVRHDKSLADATIAAVRRLKAAGVPVTLISARPPSGIYWLAEALDVDQPLGAFNGGTVFRRDGTIISQNHLPEHVSRKALDLLRENGVTRWVFADGKWFASEAEGIHHEREVAAAQLEPILTDDFEAILPRIDKIVGVSDDEPLLAGLEEQAQDLLADATVARSQPYYLDVTAIIANKGDGVAFLAEAAGVDLASVVVAGDMRNDLPMFARAGTSIAMGQGPEEVRAAATYITGSNEDDGLADAIERLILPLLEHA
ncbi:Cof-type HAD-IIB family hydrolase [Terrihabitans rhizophilus]|uniref:Cof-type HAD-IIB family hydrolase n=1 Tax=Terrihabitans rhizophilus TaxID=3092662 RepID=A0ABU4RSU2_9HYPH|nr:Cof-type HAD-IIB family hydrolase [Terrihabitans sp. PJ23]MDX6807253.1 Cof-type HAD-IIB family hydrolase [Terrihabitans sp. PJ23]